MISTPKFAKFHFFLKAFTKISEELTPTCRMAARFMRFPLIFTTKKITLER